MLFLGRMPFLLTALICAAVICIALIMEYGFGILGCTLCKYERILILVGGVVAALFLFVPQRRRPLGFLLIMVIFLGCGILAFYHVLIQQGVLPLPAFCKPPSIPTNLSLEEMRQQLLSTVFVPCNKVTWSFMGLSLAAYNVLLSLFLAAYNFVAYQRSL